MNQAKVFSHGPVVAPLAVLESRKRKGLDLRHAGLEFGVSDFRLRREAALREMGRARIRAIVVRWLLFLALVAVIVAVRSF